PVLTADRARPRAEALVDLHLDDLQIGVVVAVVLGRQRDVDTLTTDAPRAQRLVPRVPPVELVADLGETAVDAERVLGGAGALGPLAAELQPDQPAVGRASRSGRPVPPVRVRPHPPAEVLDGEVLGRADRPRPVAGRDRAGGRPGVLLRG